MKCPSNARVPAPELARRRLAAGLLAGAVVMPLAVRSFAQSVEPVIEVWTGPSCSCCHDWIAYLRANGFSVRSHDGGNRDARARLGVPARFGSCHTGEVAGFALEGHVPVREISQLLAERPDAAGLAVPAMPRGSPGMDGPAYNGVTDPYDVLLIARDGTASVYQPYP